MLIEILLGGVISLIVQAIKKYFGTSMLQTYVAVIVLSFFGGAAYYYLEGTALLEKLISIFTYAGAIYTYLVRPLNESLTKKGSVIEAL